MALRGIKVLEIAGLAPAPFAGMVLADFGADVVRIDRSNEKGRISSSMDTLARGKRSIALNLKSSDGKQVLKDMVKHADVLVEPYVCVFLGTFIHEVLTFWLFFFFFFLNVTVFAPV